MRVDRQFVDQLAASSRHFGPYEVLNRRLDARTRGVVELCLPMT
jgi:hypothetical protein